MKVGNEFSAVARPTVSMGKFTGDKANVQHSCLYSAKSRFSDFAV
jgi:hypothetical protein